MPGIPLKSAVPSLQRTLRLPLEINLLRLPTMGSALCLRGFKQVASGVAAVMSAGVHSDFWFEFVL